MVETFGRLFKNKKTNQISIVLSKKLITKEDKQELNSLIKGKVKVKVFR